MRRAPLPAALWLLALVLGSCGAQPEPPARRLLVVGWDGATFRTIDPLLEEGRLPNLAGLAQRGVSAGLESTVVPISSAAWTAAATGKSPGKTGVYSFFEHDPSGGGEVRLVSAHSNHATPIWRTLSRHGRRSVVWGVPLTYPPEPIAGVMVAGMLSPKDGAWAHPPELRDELVAAGFVPDLGNWRDVQAPPNRQRFLEQLEIKTRAVIDALQREDWSLAWIVFKNLDVLSHGEFDGRDDTSVAELCQHLDRSLGRLLQAVGPETNVLVVSDHGFQAYPRHFNALAWLLARGLAVARPGARLGPPSAGPMALTRAARQREILDYLDLSATRVLPAKSEGCFGGFRVHLRGREPSGTVPPDQLDAVVAELRAELARLRTTDGRPLVVRTWRGPELYPGPFAQRLPDLLFETQPDTVVFWNRPGTAVVGEIGRIWPDHDRRGIFFAAGPGVIPGGRLDHDLAITDVAPTALALLGLSAYRDMDGVVRTEILASGHAKSRVLEANDPSDSIEVLRWLRAGEVLDAAERAEILERMSALGYTE